MQQLIAIALGGSAGAVTRFLVANALYSLWGRGFPHATLFINVSGSFLMGFLTELMLQRFALAVEYRAAILIGFLGAYTTFSTFALETLYLLEDGGLLKAFLNIFLSTCLCLMACWAGLTWGRSLFAGDLAPWLQYGSLYLGWLLGLLGVFILAAFTELTCQSLGASPATRTSIFILLMGLAAISSTLWLSFKLDGMMPEFQGILGLFVINTLFAVAAIWLGSWAGNGIWQFKQSL